MAGTKPCIKCGAPETVPDRRICRECRNVENRERMARSAHLPCAGCGNERGTTSNVRCITYRRKDYGKPVDVDAGVGVFREDCVVWDWSGITGVCRCELCPSWGGTYLSRTEAHKAARSHWRTMHQAAPAPCAEDGCERPSFQAYGLCGTHNSRARRAAKKAA